MTRTVAFLTLGLTLAATTAPAQATPRETDFVSLHQCENYLNRWRNSLQRPNTGALAVLLPMYEAAYCAESPNGRFNVVWP